MRAIAALACWLNPATILNAETLGYLDALLMLPAMAALLLDSRSPLRVGRLRDRRSPLHQTASGVARSGRRCWRCSSWRLARAGAPRLAGMATTLAIFLPFALAGSLPNVVFALSSFGRTDILSGDAANVWWLVNWLERAWHLIPRLGFPQSYLVPVARIMALSTFLELGWPNPRPFATAAVLALVGWAVWRAAGQRRSSAMHSRARRVHRARLLHPGHCRARKPHHPRAAVPRNRRDPSSAPPAAVRPAQPVRRAQHEPVLRPRTRSWLGPAPHMDADRCERPPVVR